MQMLEIKIEDTVFEQFMSLMETLPKGSVELKNIGDPYLSIDPYYYKRKERITKLIEDVESGKEKMYDFNDSMDELIRELES